MELNLNVGLENDLKLDLYVYGAHLPPLPGVYLVMSQSLLYWRIHYVGKAEDLNARVGAGLGRHEHEAAFDAHEATHVAVWPAANMLAVDALERHLIRHFCPPINEKGNPLAIIARESERRSILGDLFR